jgi:hypothetical protein
MTTDVARTTDTRLQRRRAAHARVAPALSAMSEAELRELLAAATPLGSGIGGETLRTQVAGEDVFVKKIPVTELELLPDHVGSTANLFELPLCYQYGIGSAGFGAWRELAVHTMTTAWVLDGDFPGFPVTYHVRTLMEPGGVYADRDQQERAKRLEWFIQRWDESAQVRERLLALEQAPANAVVFMEFIPGVLDGWLHERIAEGGDALDAALALAAAELEAGAAFMRSRGLAHFDAHRANVLTDGAHLYFADFGLSTSSSFALSPEESSFFDRHADYDWALTMTELVNAVGSALRSEELFFELAADYARPGANPDRLPAASAALIRRYAPVAQRFNAFFRDLIQGPKTLPYPAEELRSARATPSS